MSAPVSRLVATMLVVVATVASLHALTSIIEPGPWTGATTWLTVAVAVAVASIREIFSHRGRSDGGASLPTLGGAIVAGWLVLATSGASGEGFRAIVGMDDVDHVGELLTAVVPTITQEVSPVVATAPIELVVTLGAIVVFLVADLLAVGLRFPAMTALPLLALWVPTLVIDGDIPVVAVALTIAPLLALLAVDTDPRAAQDGRVRTVHSTSVVLTTVCVTVGALLVGSLTSGLGPLASRSWSDTFASQGSAVRLSDDLDMRRNLDERSSQVVLTYSGEAARNLGPLRVYTASAFDGTRWLRSDSTSGDIVSPDDILWAGQPGPVGEARAVDVVLEGYRDSLLPIPLEPRTVDVDGEWRYASAQDEVRATSATSEGETYSFTTTPRALDAESLRASTGGGTVDDRYLDVPDSEYAEQITALAEEITGASSTRYDAAMALQTWFRSTENFTYTTDVAPAVTGDTVWDFLEDRNGYCVQFATSMTIMARSLGIPARLGVGFLEGDRQNGTTYKVTGEKSHAWPEIYFPGTGWVRFEPTPATQTGPAPSYADPLLDTGEAPAPVAPAPESSTPTPSAENTRTDVPEESTLATTSTAGADNGAAWHPVVAGLAAVLVAFVALLGLARRRTTPPAARPTDAAWAALQHNLSLRGFAWPDSMTPRSVPRALTTHLTTLGMDPVAAAAIEDDVQRLARAVEHARYARPRGTETDGAGRELGSVADSTDAAVSERLDAQVSQIIRSIDRELSALRRAGDPTGPRAG